VTVARDTMRRDALPRRIEVITATDIARTAAEDVAQLLKKQVAVDVIEFPGLLAGIGMRGFRPQFSGINQRTLVLIDGRPAGASNLAMLDVRGVERVEVLKGPASSLYGSNAMGGVVNLVTRRSAAPSARPRRSATAAGTRARARSAAGGNLTSGTSTSTSRSPRSSARATTGSASGTFFRDRLGDSVAVRIWPDSDLRLSPSSAAARSGRTRSTARWAATCASATTSATRGASTGAWSASTPTASRTPATSSLPGATTARSRTSAAPRPT
jgi:vitamin B12 transporter